MTRLAGGVRRPLLDGPAAYVWIVGHRPATMPTRSGLTFTDLLLTFALLREPGLVARPLRDIAATTGVSLGKVSGTLGVLEDQRYVARRPRRRRILQDAHRLLKDGRSATWRSYGRVCTRPTGAYRPGLT